MKYLKSFLSSIALTAAALASGGAQASLVAPQGGQTFNVSLVSATGALDAGWTTVGRIAALGAGSFGGSNMPGTLAGGSAGAVSAVNWAGNCPGYTCAGWQTSYLTQEVTGLTVGQKYTLSFSEAAFNNVWTSSWAPIGWGQNSRWWEVSLGSEMHNSAAIMPNIVTSLGNYTQAHTDWLSQAMTFTATASTETLRFLARGNVGDPEYLYLDNLKITNTAPAVPEPGTYALMTLGLLAIGLLVHRRLG